MKGFIPRAMVSCLMVLLACGPASKEQAVEETIFTNVRIIPMTSETVLEGQSVVIRDSRIYKIGPDEEVTPGTLSTVIDAQGGYLLPGIAEMHAHIPRPGPGPDLVGQTLMLYLSNGITTIRGMLGHESHLQLRKDVQSGSVLGPTIYTSSPSMNGNSVPSIAMADSLVRAHKTAGYDFLKVHPGIQREVFDAMVATANEVGMGYSGHVPYDVGIRRALESRYGSIDHVDGFVEGLVQEGEYSEEANGFFGFNSAQTADHDLIAELVQLTVDNQVWVVPTQSLFDRWGSPQGPDFYADQPEMKYMSPETVENWKNSKRSFLSNDYYSDDKYEVFIALRRKLIKALNDGGHGLILGSDAPQVFNVPGFSIQHEMKGMVASGLTPYEVLRTGTINVARFFGKEGEFGEVSEGGTADLILLEANPLEDISNMETVKGVMVRGRWLDRDFIDGELEKIAAGHAGRDNAD